MDVTPTAEPRLHAVWQSGVIGLWCETGLRRPESIAPASAVTAVARAGAPSEVVEFLDRFSLVHRIVVRVPVEGRVRPATVPGIRISVAAAVELCRLVDPRQYWVGPGLRALKALSTGVAAFVRAGHVVPVLTRLDGSWEASWALAVSPAVSAWMAESLSRCHGLIASREELERLLAALTDHHCRAALAPLASARHSALGTALIAGDEVSSGGQALAEAVAEFGRAAAARDVEVVFRVVEPSGGENLDDAPTGDEKPDGQVLWRLEALVRTGADSLRPFSELPLSLIHI